MHRVLRMATGGAMMDVAQSARGAKGRAARCRMIARLGAVIFVLLTMAFVVAAIVYGNSDPGGDPDAIRQHERMFDLLRAAAFCSFICALFFGAMAELKRELEGIH